VTAVGVMIVDDFTEWRLRLRSLLAQIPGFRVITEADNGLDAVEKAAELHPDIVLLDIGMPLMNGIEAAPLIRKACPTSKIIFLTQEHDKDIRAAALATGAAAYVLKSTIAGELQRTLESSVQN
jgi:two-component system, NarL family, response regulator NreC